MGLSLLVKSLKMRDLLMEIQLELAKLSVSLQEMEPTTPSENETPL